MLQFKKWIVVFVFFVSDWGMAIDHSKSQHQKKQAVVEGYAGLVFETYKQSLTSVTALHDAVLRFEKNPNKNTYARMKTSWIKARMDYGLTEAFRFYEGPIDNEKNGPEGLINAWPLDEVYIEGLKPKKNGEIQGGIIGRSDLYPVINKDVLLKANELGGEKNISTGFHAVEFLLWGRDRTPEGRPQPGSAGLRTYHDYLETSPYGERRMTYLKVATSLLVEHLSWLTGEWNPRKRNNYVDSFLASEPSKNITDILTALATLASAELAGERLFVAVDEGDEEHEQSCFSDTTHLDTMANFQGIENVLYGRLDFVGYQSAHDDKVTIERKPVAFIAESNFMSLLKESSPAEWEKLKVAFKKTRTSIRNIEAPFDVAIVASPEKVMATVSELRSLGRRIVVAGAQLGAKVSVASGD